MIEYLKFMRRPGWDRVYLYLMCGLIALALIWQDWLMAFVLLFFWFVTKTMVYFDRKYDIHYFDRNIVVSNGRCPTCGQEVKGEEEY